MTISGRTKLIAHLGFPTESFKAPIIYNPYFEKYDIDAVVVPMALGKAQAEARPLVKEKLASSGSWRTRQVS
jgi:shikimate 5-dehydrogenase